ncbi:hypothetical protein [uncultured Sphingomonas sp.]|uniref:hypothetical protein n=1 Tax=uncultured Sphingomonas sp. TaxID=158754 RepID=UPI002610601E|nr:hypothetical protein [uncultured Sphingomonas sp.]
MYDIVIRYEDGHRSTLDDRVGDLGEACAFVLKLADELGGKAIGGHAPAKWVEIYREQRLEISVSVVRGGLLRQKDA